MVGVSVGEGEGVEFFAPGFVGTGLVEFGRLIGVNVGLEEEVLSAI